MGGGVTSTPRSAGRARRGGGVRAWAGVRTWEGGGSTALALPLPPPALLPSCGWGGREGGGGWGSHRRRAPPAAHAVGEGRHLGDHLNLHVLALLDSHLLLGLHCGKKALALLTPINVPSGALGGQISPLSRQLHSALALVTYPL